MSAPDCADLIRVIHEVKRSNPEFGSKRVIREVRLLKPDWALSEKRLRKHLRQEKLVIEPPQSENTENSHSAQNRNENDDTNIDATRSKELIQRARSTSSKRRDRRQRSRSRSRQREPLQDRNVQPQAHKAGADATKIIAPLTEDAVGPLPQTTTEHSAVSQTAGTVVTTALQFLQEPANDFQPISTTEITTTETEYYNKSTHVNTPLVTEELATGTEGTFEERDETVGMPMEDEMAVDNNLPNTEAVSMSAVSCAGLLVNDEYVTRNEEEGSDGNLLAASGFCETSNVYGSSVHEGNVPKARGDRGCFSGSSEIGCFSGPVSSQCTIC